MLTSPYLSINETAFSQGDLYTITTNKKAKGRKGALVVITVETKAEPVVKQLLLYLLLSATGFGRFL